MDYLAHIRKSDAKKQFLHEHLAGVAEISGRFASKIGLGKYGKITGLLHDLGKYSNEFQNYIKSAEGLINPDEDDYVDAYCLKGKIDHSSAGAQLIYRNLSGKGQEGLLAAQIFSLCIASHHSGLIDCVSPNGSDNFNRRMTKSPEKTHFDEANSYMNDEIKLKFDTIISESLFIKDLIYKLRSLRETNDSKETLSFKYGLLIRFLYSCLIDADRLNTADFEFPSGAKLRNNGDYVAWNILIERLNTKLLDFEKKENKNNVDKLRQEISAHCYDFSTKPKGLYQLTVPTGGGKTFASLRFALSHADYHKMDRVIYVIPYTSIIDQNAEETRKILEDKNDKGEYLNRVVLEHHSNLTPDEENYRQKLLSEDWDAPIVFTTSVQVLEALYGAGTRSARRMHQLANSVIIFDEVQTIPVRCVHLFNLALRFLTQNCGSTAILCTATQPLLDKVEPNQRALQIMPEQQMMPDVKRLFDELKRVDVFDLRKVEGWTECEVKELAKAELKETGSVLIIVNTKNSAIKLYQEIKTFEHANIFHLSTNMCPAHRLEILNQIKDCLPDEKPVICISTQLIEAGVDIDFGSVIRYLAGLDSIAQAAGRCNRNGTRPKQGRVSIVNSKEENLDRLKEIKTGREKAERVLDEYKNNPGSFNNDILGLAAMNQYYQYYFYERSQDMKYPVSKDSIVGRDDNLFNLLSENSLSVAGYKRININDPTIPCRQAFMTASKTFKAIESSARGIVVPFGKKGRCIINDLCAADDLEKQFKLLKEAQRYSVNIFPHIWDKLDKQNAIHEAQEGTGIFYLDSQYYSDRFGLSEEPVNEMDILIG